MGRFETTDATVPTVLATGSLNTRRRQRHDPAEGVGGAPARSPGFRRCGRSWLLLDAPSTPQGAQQEGASDEEEPLHDEGPAGAENQRLKVSAS